MFKQTAQNERLRLALDVLGVARELPDKWENALSDFADAVGDSAYAAQCDWRLTNAAVLMELIAHSGAAAIEVEEEGDDCVVTVEHEDGSELSTRFENIGAEARDKVVARFVRLMPKPHTVLKVRAYEGSDTDLYVVLEVATAERVRQTLEAEFATVFAELTPN